MTSRDVLRWVAILTLLILCFANFKDSPLSSLFFLFSALILVPKLRLFLIEKVKIQNSLFYKGLSILFLTSAFYLRPSQRAIELKRYKELNEDLFKIYTEVQKDSAIKSYSQYLDRIDNYSREELSIKNQFNAWDGSHIKLTKYIKDNMHDHSSFEHIETYYFDKNDYLEVTTIFRGKNAFGAIVKNKVKAKVSKSGEILEILE